jgi:hypothetical protein
VIGAQGPVGYEIRLKPRGVGRIFASAFLTFWLCGWAVGESFALLFVFKAVSALATGEPLDSDDEPMQLGAGLAAVGFMLVWVTVWTFGGPASGRSKGKVAVKWGSWRHRRDGRGPNSGPLVQLTHNLLSDAESSSAAYLS